MTVRILSILLLVTFLASDGEKDGRRGNELYDQGQFDLAAEAFESGIASLSQNAPALLRYGLLNNLGAALLKAGEAETSGEAFARALESAPGAADIARTSYNAGNASFGANDLETALAHYRRSLIAEPDNEDAKFNYEFVKRQLEQQQEQQQQDGRQDEDQESDEQEQEDGEQEPEGGDEEQQGGDQEQQEREQGQNGQDEQDQGGGDEGRDELEQEESRESEGQPQPAPNALSAEEAERILQALQNEEEQLLRQVQRPNSPARQVEKDW